MNETTKIIISYVLTAVIFAAVGFFAGCNTTKKSYLMECLEGSRDTPGIFNDKMKDSAVRSKCDRYHRKEISDEIDSQRVMVPLTKYNHKTGKYEKVKKEGTEEDFLVPAATYTNSEKILYIEKGIAPK